MTSQVIVQGFDPEGPFAGMFVPPALRKRQSETRFKQEWRLTLAQYAQMMRDFRGPRGQRGSLQMLAGMFGDEDATGGVVVVNPHSFAALDDSGEALGDPCTSGVRFHDNGRLSEVETVFTITTLITLAGEWWSNQPESSIGDSYEARSRAAGKVGTWTFAGAADDVWTPLSVNKNWGATVFSGFSTKTTSATFEVGLDGTSTALDAATILCAATRQP